MQGVRVPTASVNGVSLYYESQGEGLPLVFAHGGGGDLFQWTFQVPHFSERYRTITFDNRTRPVTKSIVRLYCRPR